jgi:(E)-4-hydroxy-3-methyl-but-2-enyl pyrophosphate reductase
MSKRVLLAAPRSFCAGVDRAIEIVERLLTEHGPPIYVRHQIVHNDHVVRRLERMGAVFVDGEEEVPPGEICVLSAHGVAPAVRENCERRGLRVVDAVCPLVSKVHAEARRYADSGHLVALVGHADHVEVIGTRGERPDSTVVVESPEEAAQLESSGRPVAVISQTTLSLDDVRATVDALEQRFGGLKRPAADDICYATQNRQDAVKRLAEEATLFLVIGSHELERAAPRRGRAQRRRGGAADRRGERVVRGAAERPRRHRLDRRRVDAGTTGRSDDHASGDAWIRRGRGDHGCARGRPLPTAAGGRLLVTSVEIPVSIAAALPTLTVLDITNEVRREVASAGGSGIAYVSPNGDPSVIRVQERETGFFHDLESLLERLVPLELGERERLVSLLLGPRTEQIPFVDGSLSLGQWQRILLVGFDTRCSDEWMLTVVGE